jgi:hypothetical protein
MRWPGSRTAPLELGRREPEPGAIHRPLVGSPNPASFGALTCEDSTPCDRAGGCTASRWPQLPVPGRRAARPGARTGNVLISRNPEQGVVAPGGEQFTLAGSGLAVEVFDPVDEEVGSHRLALPGGERGIGHLSDLGVGDLAASWSSQMAWG